MARKQVARTAQPEPAIWAAMDEDFKRLLAKIDELEAKGIAVNEIAVDSVTGQVYVNA